MKPPVTTPGTIFCIPDFCEICSRHFLIAGELQEHLTKEHTIKIDCTKLLELYDVEQKND